MDFRNEPLITIATPVPTPGCAEHNRLLDDFGVAVQDVLELHEQQFLAIVGGEDDFCRFDVLIHMANERKLAAKYAYLRHVEAHGCSSDHVLNSTHKTRTRSHH